MTIQLRYRVFAALLLALLAISAGNALAQDASIGTFTKADCDAWTPVKPLDRKNVADDFALKWKDYLRRDLRSDQLNQALRCLGLHLATLEASIEDQTRAVAGGAYLNDVEKQLDDVRNELRQIHQALNELSVLVSHAREHVPAGGDNSVSFSNSLSAELRKLINQQARLSESLLEKLDLLHKEPSWILFNGEGLGGASAPVGEEPAGEQVRADADLARLFPDATRIEFAIATVADPRVPRHRRLYDNAITAIGHGLLQNGFVLDRYEFPWQDALKSQGNADQALLKLVSEDGRFGLMVYRRDDWRYDTDSSKATIQVRAVYVVPETATYGIQSAAFAKALRRIEDQLLVRGRSKETLEIFGPTFSGSLDSLAREAAHWDSTELSPSVSRAIENLKATSASATASSNLRVGRRGSRPFEFSTLVETDASKLKAIEKLQDALGLSNSSTALLYETSVFGFDACQGADAPGVCAKAVQIAFPANIADVRFGLRKREAERARARNSPILPTTRLPHLSLEEGAENGSEFPSSFQSPLTAVANQLDLDVAVSTIERKNPRMAVIIATDVRDRLFLFEQLRSQLENTLLLDLETDRLLAHPDVMNVSRGAMTLASSEIVTVNDAWSTDHQAIIAGQFCNWSRNNVATGASSTCDSALGFDGRETERGVHVHVVTRNGLASASQTLAACKAANAGERDENCSAALPLVAPALTIMFCVLLTWMWSWKPDPAQPKLSFTRCLDRRIWFLVPLILPLLYVQPGGRPMLLLIIVGIVGVIFALYRTYAAIEFRMDQLRAGNSGLRTEWTWRALPRSAALMILAVAILESWNAYFIYPVSEREFSVAYQAELLRVALTGNSASGLAYGMAVSAVGGALLYAFAASKAYSSASHRNQFVRGLAIVDEGEASPPRPGNVLEWAKATASTFYVRVRQGGCVWVIVALGGFSALWVIVSEVLSSGTRLTVFGARASVTIYIGLVAVTLTGAIMFVAALWIVSQINSLRSQLGGLFNGFKWDLSSNATPNFAVTPILATTEAAPPCIMTLVEQPETWHQKFQELLARSLLPAPRPGTNDLWLAPSALLASYMMIYRWSVVGVLIAALAAAGIVYLFPVSDSDGLLLFNLALLLGVGLHSAFVTVQFESCEILSMVLCNREKEASWSTKLFAFIAFPFAALAIAVAIAQIPGVLNWGDGVFDVLIKLTRPSALK